MPFDVTLGGNRTFLLTPLREGRLALARLVEIPFTYFYSRPCGRGDLIGSI